jgi:DNA repair exonuclease SbcCD ATPase subunit
LLGLKHYQDKIEKISIQISELEKKNELFQFSHDSLTKNITDLQSLNEQPPTKPDYTDEEITVGNEEIKKLEGQLRALQNELFAKTSELIKPIKQSASFDSSKILRLSSEINSLKNNRTSIINLFMTTKQDLQKNISKFQYAISDIKRARNDAQRISLEVAKLQNEKELVSKSICPTCSQTWVGVQVAAKVKAVEDSIKLNINKILELKNVIDQEAVIEAQIIDLQNQLNVLTVPDTLEIDNKIKELEIIYIAEKSAEQSFLKTIENKYLQEYSAYQESNRLISNHYNMEIQEVTKKLNDIKNAVMTVTRALDYYQRSVNEYNSRLARNQQLVTAKTQELNVLITSNEAIKKKLLVAQEAKRLIKSYTLRIFQETLDTIGETASRIIGNVDNLTNCTIYFEGCKETKSGTIKDEVNPIVNFEGENDVPIKSLSGGQRTVVDLAVDLAVIDVIESKTGKGVCWFAIEEPFEGLAEDNKEQILQMLTQMHLNKQIILVDHSPVVKSIVRDQIHII